MKDKRYKKIIILNIAISVALITALASIIIFIFNLNTLSSQKIRKINSEIRAIDSKNKNNSQKLINIDKYEKQWSGLSERSKSTRVLKSNEVNKLIDDISKKYHIKNIQFAIKVPTKLSGGKFRKETIKIFTTSGSIGFSASDDARALRFIKEFFSSLPGNVIIESLSLTKPRSYSDSDYISISKIGSLSKIRARVKFHWYSKREI